MPSCSTGQSPESPVDKYLRSVHVPVYDTSHEQAIRVRVRVRVRGRVRGRGGGIISTHTCMQGKVVRHAV